MHINVFFFFFFFQDLGHGVLIPTGKWDIVRRLEGDSKFCKSLAVVRWGTTVLKQRSVTGMKCNAKPEAEAKPPLSPEKISAIKGKTVKFSYN